MSRYLLTCRSPAAKRHVDILETKDLEREFLLARSRLTLVHHHPPSAAIAGGLPPAPPLTPPSRWSGGECVNLVCVCPGRKCLGGGGRVAAGAERFVRLRSESVPELPAASDVCVRGARLQVSHCWHTGG